MEGNFRPRHRGYRSGPGWMRAGEFGYWNYPRSGRIGGDILTIIDANAYGPSRGEIAEAKHAAKVANEEAKLREQQLQQRQQLEFQHQEQEKDKTLLTMGIIIIASVVVGVMLLRK